MAKTKPQQFRSSLDEQMDEEPVPGLQSMPVQPNPCPKYCPKFVCILKDSCNKKCRNLDVIKATICDICENEQNCPENRRKFLLESDYTKQVEENKKDIIKTNMEELKALHRHEELVFKETHEKIAHIKWYEMTVLPSLKRTEQDAMQKIVFYRDLFKKFNVEYTPDVVIQEGTTMNSITTLPQKKPMMSISNIIMIIGIAVLVVVYILFG